MIKDTETTFKYVKLEQNFLNEVFMAGSDNNLEVTYVSPDDGFVNLRYKKFTMSTVGLPDPCIKIINSFEAVDALNNEDVQNQFIDDNYTKMLQNGMVKTLAKRSKAQAMQYIAAYIEHEHIKIGSRMEELVDALDEQE